MQKQLFINNEYVDAKSDETLTIYSPHDETLVAEGIQVAGQDDVDAAVAAAQAAFKGEWSKWTPAQKTQVMMKLADLIDEHAEELGVWEAKAMGQPVAVAGQLVRITSTVIRYYAGWTDKISGEQYPIDDKGIYKVMQYHPIGVCAGIGAWNGAPAFFGFKVASAVATGCTIVYKASEKSPIGVLQLGELVKEAGFPPGVINIISGDGRTGAMLARHMGIRKISFTGSVPVGKKIQEEAAKSNLKRVVLELGGKSPSMIFNDADIENALTHSSQNFLFNTGQGCVSASRAFIQEDIAPKFIDALKERFDQFKHAIGAPLDPNTFIGPLADGKQMERVMGFLESGKNEAELVTGGNRHGDTGFYVEPTIFLNPKDGARIYREEIFGPVLTIKTFKTEEEAVEMANDTEYGLSACVFTSSTSRALRVAGQIESGMVNINTSQVFGIDSSFGGWKQSGIGREGGRAGLMEFLQGKLICIK
ncbi:putative aldehyde dehydrogenase [Massariosphaeria phaeospora]|uniref:aldehyde dehydrogenase (NAD(+)) n=1 Tax=Massariosphaeria phaeospora TaxID=100035 RepID=A0A7C8M0Y8_9PLEO|nr:putative aldehyde dehydrogenase [Massariosphaeria phaeospora]